ncbi:CLUMA_CG017043, isoform A [Clunio marinus]|uniref:CLUMA_CG017043, isoform A n=1 Tax=Clunio marinus TaxID=568069 RepID=A0A1J1IW46_9DIPT|nr:CLUMA_CG017043, isoform A [Clunio marinus]
MSHVNTNGCIDALHLLSLLSAELNSSFFNENDLDCDKITDPTYNEQDIVTSYIAKDNSKCLEIIKLLEENGRKLSFHSEVIKTICLTHSNSETENVFAILNNVINEEPKNSFAFYALGLAQYMNCRLADSEESFKTAIDLNSNGEKFPYKELEDSTFHYLRCVRMAVHSIEEAHCLFHSGYFREAIQEIKNAAKYDLTNINLNMNLTKIFFKYTEFLMNHVNNSHGVNQEVFDKSKETEELIMSHKFFEADNNLNTFSFWGSFNGEHIYLKGLLEYMKGDPPEAIKKLQLALRIDYTEKKVHELMDKALSYEKSLEDATLKMKDKKFTEAIEILTKALEIDKNNHLLNQAVYFQRSFAYRGIGDTEKAREDVEKYNSFKDVLGNILNDLNEIIP